MTTIRRSGRLIMLDDEDVERVLALEKEWGAVWSVIKRDNSVMMNCGGFPLYLSRFLLGYSGPLVVDHIDGDKKNNRIKNLRNLRVVTQQVNRLNCHKTPETISGIVGVCWRQRLRKWQAHVKLDGKAIHLGLFLTKEQAKKAREDYLAQVQL